MVQPGRNVTIKSLDTPRRCLLKVLAVAPLHIFAKTLPTLSLLACESSRDLSPIENQTDTAELGSLNIVVLADPHVYNRKLGVNGKALSDYLKRDTKLLLESEDILKAFVDHMLAIKPRPDLVLVAGDLTKDGELVNHELFINYLERLKEADIKVFVVPGNHDIDNPHAFSYEGDAVASKKSVSKEEYRILYYRYGYDVALYWDPDSLSYIAEPYPGLWLFAIDSNRYAENDISPVHGGAISSYTEQWVMDYLQEAQNKGKVVIFMLHHLLVEHAKGMSQYSYDLLLDDWERIGYRFSTAGLRLVLSGHSHSQKITRREWEDGSYLYELQTGSLVANPNPYRMIKFDLDRLMLDVSTNYVHETNIDDKLDLNNHKSFQDLSLSTARRGVHFNAHIMLSDHLGHELSADDNLIENVVDAVIAYSSGDPHPSLYSLFNALSLSNSDNELESQVGMMLLSLWSGLPPQDLEIRIKI